MTERLRVLFVCTANICRSPAMELLARQLGGDALEPFSAGTHGYDGRPLDPPMTVPLRARGVPDDEIAAFQSRPVTPDLVDGADLVLTAQTTHRAFVLEQRPEAADKVFTLGQFAVAVGDAGGAAGTDLVRAVAALQLPEEVALDLADPYRRGPEAAAGCADQVESLLRVAVPALVGSGRISP